MGEAATIPGLRRFISEDPERGKADLFTYAGDSPISGSDLSGMDDSCPNGDCAGGEGGGGYNEGGGGGLSFDLGSVIQAILNFFGVGSSSPTAPVVSPNSYAHQAQLQAQFGGTFETARLNNQQNVFSQSGTVQQVAAVVYHETSVLTGPNLEAARVAMAHARINGLRTVDPPATASDAVPTGLPAAGRRIWNQCLAAAQQAALEDQQGIDPTHGAIHFNLRTTNGTYPNKNSGERPTMVFGPFDNPIGRDRFIDIYP
jgi:hypothetical protein